MAFDYRRLHSCIPSRVWGYPVMASSDSNASLVAGPFRLDGVHFIRNPRFDWGYAVEWSFHACMAPMVARFMRVE